MLCENGKNNFTTDIKYEYAKNVHSENRRMDASETIK